MSNPFKVGDKVKYIGNLEIAGVRTLYRKELFVIVRAVRKETIDINYVNGHGKALGILYGVFAPYEEDYEANDI